MRLDEVRQSNCLSEWLPSVILIMRPDQPTKAIKINKPLEAVTAADLSDALAPLACVSDAQGAIADEVMVSRMSSSSSTPA